MSDSYDDFPAAHSMDTAWFAIDDDGHVAFFDTGAAGAVPETALLDEDELPELVEALHETRAASAPIFDLAGWAAGAAEPHLPAVAFSHGFARGAVVFVRAPADVADVVAKLSLAVHAATTGVALLGDFDAAAHAALHDRALCLGCFFPAGNTGGEDEPAPAAHGLFQYEQTDEWIAEPYARLLVPSQPLTADELPPAIRRRAVNFAGRFAETPRFQPAERWSCAGWESAWVASDGRTVRPLPGREADYAAARDELAKSNPKHTFLASDTPKPAATLAAPDDADDADEADDA